MTTVFEIEESSTTVGDDLEIKVGDLFIFKGGLVPNTKVKASFGMALFSLAYGSSEVFIVGVYRNFNNSMRLVCASVVRVYDPEDGICDEKTAIRFFDIPDNGGLWQPTWDDPTDIYDVLSEPQYETVVEISCRLNGEEE